MSGCRSLGRRVVEILICLAPILQGPSARAQSIPGSQLGKARVPHWIQATAPDTTPWRFAASFTPKATVQSARLKLAVDFATARILVNDHPSLVVGAYCPLQSIDVTPWVQPGENRLTVVLERVPGPSAVAFALQLQLTTGELQEWVSGDGWARDTSRPQTDAACVERGPVRRELFGIDRRDISLSAVENYEQWQMAGGKDSALAKPKFWTTPGFEVSVLREASPNEGSWIAAAFDDQGRLIVSREDKGFLRMTLDSDRRSVERVENIEAAVDECRGLAQDGPWLYANANNSKGLYRLQIDPDGQVQDLLRLREFPGGVGHGRNDLSIFDGWLYSIHGDSVDVPTDDVTDLTSPLRHLPGDVSKKEGCLLRMNLKSRQWELVTAGLRNPFGIAIHRQGEAFTFDADNEYDMGTPWYRPTRLIGLLPGGDVGYRTANHKLPPRFHDQPENLPPVLTIGRSSPTAVLFDDGLRFPSPYRNALYLLDWTYGRVIAVHLARRGAFWRAQPELFLQGRPLNVTDMAAGPDGALYLVTGGRKTQSGLYRIAYAGTLHDESDTSQHERASLQFSTAQCELRAQLESISRDRDGRGLARVLAALKDADPALRHAARIAMERLPKDPWSAIVGQSADDRTWVQAALALSQQASPTEASALVERWLAVDPSRWNLSEQLAWLRVLELCHRASPERLQPLASAIAQRLVQVWPNRLTIHVAPEGNHIALRHKLALLATRFAKPVDLENILRELLSSDLQEDRIAALLALRQQSDGWSNELRILQLAALQDTTRMIGGEGLPAFMNAIRTETHATLSEEERQGYAELLKPKKRTMTSPAQPRPFVRQWNLENLVELASERSVRGNARQGEKVFREAQCSRCHRMGNVGESIGPDLTLVGRRFGPRDLIEAIVHPSRSVAEQYRLESVVTESGQVHTGRLVVQGDYRSEKLLMQTDPLSEEVLEIDKRQIVDHRVLDRSPMPDALMDTFTQDQIRDLLAYLQDPK